MTENYRTGEGFPKVCDCGDPGSYWCVLVEQWCCQPEWPCPRRATIRGRDADEINDQPECAAPRDSQLTYLKPPAPSRCYAGCPAGCECKQPEPGRWSNRPEDGPVFSREAMAQGLADFKAEYDAKMREMFPNCERCGEVGTHSFELPVTGRRATSCSRRCTQAMKVPGWPEISFPSDAALLEKARDYLEAMAESIVRLSVVGSSVEKE